MISIGFGSGSCWARGFLLQNHVDVLFPQYFLRVPTRRTWCKCQEVANDPETFDTVLLLFVIYSTWMYRCFTMESIFKKVRFGNNLWGRRSPTIIWLHFKLKAFLLWFQFLFIDRSFLNITLLLVHARGQIWVIQRVPFYESMKHWEKKSPSTIVCLHQLLCLQTNLVGRKLCVTF